MKKIAMILACLMMLTALVGCGEEKAPAVTAPEGAVIDLIDKVYENITVDLPLMSMPVELSDGDMVKTYVGADSTEGIKEAVVSESMIGAQAYSMTMVRMETAEQADAMADTMFQNIDTRKWICVEATEKQAVVCGDLVMFIMLDPELGATTDQIVEAFTTVCGGNVTRVVK